MGGIKTGVITLGAVLVVPPITLLLLAEPVVDERCVLLGSRAIDPHVANIPTFLTRHS